VTTTRAHPLILIADDDWMSREVLQSFLEGAGYRVIAAANGSDTLNLARERQPMLAVVDVRMNDMSGYEVCKLIKQDGATGTMKVMLITALLREQERNSAAQAGADDVISKSLDWNVILTRVCKLLPLGA
jgi:CheY-like chemotaxis protein